VGPCPLLRTAKQDLRPACDWALNPYMLHATFRPHRSAVLLTFGQGSPTVSDEDVHAATKLVALDAVTRKIVTLRGVIEADTDGRRKDGQLRVCETKDFIAGQRYKHFLDVAPVSFDEPAVQRMFAEARTIFVNAVMGRMPEYVEGTVALNAIIAQNRTAQKLYGGGDTLQVLQDPVAFVLHPPVPALLPLQTTDLFSVSTPLTPQESSCRNSKPHRLAPTSRR
jgi:hypothetical protein